MAAIATSASPRCTAGSNSEWGTMIDTILRECYTRKLRPTALAGSVWECLVEVVDVENQRSLGRGEAAKVQEVAIAARMNGDPRHARACEVPRLNDGGTAKEFERRLGHALILHRDEGRDPIGVGFLQPFDRMVRLRARLPLGMCAAWAFRAGLSPGFAFQSWKKPQRFSCSSFAPGMHDGKYSTSEGQRIRWNWRDWAALELKQLESTRPSSCRVARGGS